MVKKQRFFTLKILIELFSKVRGFQGKALKHFYKQ